jgi:hypothetical protein
MGWVPGRQSYWDAKVKEMCNKDGGVTIYERVSVPKIDLERGVLPVGADGQIGISLGALAHPDAPIYGERTETYLREGNPVVSRIEWKFVRRSDQKTVATSISYMRGGGDVPSPSQPSSFRCPDSEKQRSDLQKLFVVDEGFK